MNRPEIVSVGVVWDSERPSLDHIMDVFATVGTTLHLSDVFHRVVDDRWAVTTTHNLVGVVTYYGKHYSTFFFHTKLRVWIYFDDATVREVGPRWEQVVEKCRRGRYQPLLLLYAVPGGTPVNTENAPKMVTPLQTEKSLNKKPPPAQSLLRRSVTPSPEKPNVGNTRRAITPNPDGTLYQLSNQQRNGSLPRSYNEYQNLSVIQDNLYGTAGLESSVDTVDGDISREPSYISRRAVENVLHAQHTKLHPVQRTLSSGSSTSNPSDGISIPEHQNIPRRRDSGNWSGDRNSASSSSSTTMDNPYLYLMGKMQHRPGSVPGSPTRTKAGDSSSGSSAMYDAGYDSYSLSSNDSLPIQQGLKHNLSLAKIPENYQTSNIHYRPPHSPLSPTSPTAPAGDDCEKLCHEADQLLDKSRQAEDLETALRLCNAAACKARAAMDAPYNNPNAMVFARMKHNTCIMRARGLHRRILQEKEEKEGVVPDIRHTREGSTGSAGRHSRQNSRDKTHSHSRQNSKELLATVPAPVEKVSPKNIEIYATLPKKKGVFKSKSNSINIEEDSEYMLYDKSPGRESRSIFSRSKSKDDDKKEKRSRSEDRNKISRDFSLAPTTESLANAKDTLKREKYKEEKDEKKDAKEAKAGKKQHKVRRKLLMGGLIRRKNRSMPDLTEGKNEPPTVQISEKTMSSVDDSSVGLKGTEKISSMCGYLSEGHLEFTGNCNNANPNLERSRLMRKSFHGSAGKVLTVAKVPPPPPVRTTSQLSASKLPNGEVCQPNDRPPYPLPVEAINPSYYHHPGHQIYANHSNNPNTSHAEYNLGPQSLPFLPSYKDKIPNTHPIHQSHQMHSNQSLYDGVKRKFSAPATLYNEHTVVTQADVHQEQSPYKNTSYNEQYQTQIDSGVDEVDCAIPNMREAIQDLELPPYPSPLASIVHSRQASEEFPPPPTLLDLSALDEQLKVLRETPSPNPSASTSSLLCELQKKRQQILSQEKERSEQNNEPIRSSGETWLRELQAKQAALKMKKTQDNEPRLNNINNHEAVHKMINQLVTSNFIQDSANVIKQVPAEISRDIPPTDAKVTSVKDLASRFEQVKIPTLKSDHTKVNTPPIISSIYSDSMGTNTITSIPLNDIVQPANQNNDHLLISGARENGIETGVLSVTRRNSVPESHGIDPSQIEEEIKEVELICAAVKQGLQPDELEKKNKRNKAGKKKSVSFCDQVILVATAEDQEDDSYIPNPILERVLRSALNKPETAAIQQEIRSLREAELKKETAGTMEQYARKSPIIVEDNVNIQQNTSQPTTPLISVQPQQFVPAQSPVYPQEQREYPLQNMVNGQQPREYQVQNIANNQPGREYQNQNMVNGQVREYSTQNMVNNSSGREYAIQNMVNGQAKEYLNQNMVNNQPAREYPIQNMVNPQQTREYLGQTIQHEVERQSPVITGPHQQPYVVNQTQNTHNIQEAQMNGPTSPYLVHPYNTNSVAPQINNQHRSAPQYVPPPNHAGNMPPHPSLYNQQYPPTSPLSSVSSEVDYYKTNPDHTQYPIYQSQPSNNYNHINQPIRQSPVQQPPTPQQYSPYYHANQPNQPPNYSPPHQQNYHNMQPHPVQPYNINSPSPLTIAQQQHQQYVTKMPPNSAINTNGIRNGPNQQIINHSPSPNYYPQQSQSINMIQPPYQRVPLPADFQATNHQRFAQMNGADTSPYQRVPSTTNGPNAQSPQIIQPPYQHIPTKMNGDAHNHNSPYQRVPLNSHMSNNPPQEISPYQHVPTKMNGDVSNSNLPNQRVPPMMANSINSNSPNPQSAEISPYQQLPPNTKYSPYQYALPPKQILQQKKSVHFEPGTKGGTESPTPKAIVSPIIVNNSVNNPNCNKTKCNLCRKKFVASADLYCGDCEFYMSRFKPRTTQ